MMNIAEALNFDKAAPATYMVKRTDKMNIVAVGLLRDQMLQKHKALIPTLLTVLKGSIEFHIGLDKIELTRFDTHEIPVNVEHEVLGLDHENIFTLTQEK